MPVDFNSKTVAQLRVLAKTYGVTLGAGVSKKDIVEKLIYALGADFEEETPEATPAKKDDAVPTLSVEELMADAPKVVEPAKPEPTIPAKTTESKPETQFRAAWHNPTPAPQPRYNSRPAYSAPAQTTYQSRTPSNPLPQRMTQGGDAAPHIGTVRPANFVPRFGPGSTPSDAAKTPVRRPDAQPHFVQSAPQVHPTQPAPQQPYPQQQPVYQQQPYQAGGYQQQPMQPSYAATRPQQNNYQQGGYQRREPAYTPAPQQPYPSEPVAPSLSELLTASDIQDSCGVLELHPDGYGFLRSASTLIPSSKDIYISQAQIRRFNLRNGDFITGKTRPQQAGDKYTALLYITDVNGEDPDRLSDRPNADQLTPCYPTRRIKLSVPEGKTPLNVRTLDCLAPIGFGQRALLLAPPNTGKRCLLRDLANTITDANPDATVMVMLVEENPEDVTLFRDEVHCDVVATTFNMTPENHLRLADLVIDRAARLMEQGRDVVVLCDSLTRLSKAYASASVAPTTPQRTPSGLVNPTSLLRAKRLFGAARNLREGGSLTVIATMNVHNGNKVDDVITEEFKGTANMELTLDSSLAAKDLRPAINPCLTGTRHADLFLSEDQYAGYRLMRSKISNDKPENALQHLFSILEQSADGTDLHNQFKTLLAD